MEKDRGQQKLKERKHGKREGSIEKKGNCLFANGFWIVFLDLFNVLALFNGLVMNRPVNVKAPVPDYHSCPYLYNNPLKLRQMCW